MSHLMKLTEWQSESGKFHAGDVSDLAHGSNYWYNIPRMLGMELTDYILWLKDEFNASNFRYFKDSNLLLWDWNQSDCHRFLLYINKESRKRKFMI